MLLKTMTGRVAARGFTRVQKNERHALCLPKRAVSKADTFRLDKASLFSLE